MTITTKITTAKIPTILAALAITAAVTLPSSQAEARPRWGGGAIAAGLVGGALLGAALAGPSYAQPVYYGYAPRRCRVVRAYDAYGYYVGRQRVCDHY